jgi:hypothetical protein
VHKYNTAQAMDEDLHMTLQLVSGLRHLLCSRNESLDEEMAQIQRILTPTQVYTDIVMFRMMYYPFPPSQTTCRIMTQRKYYLLYMAQTQRYSHSPR